MLSNKKSVRDLIELLAQAGVKHVVISPGSRNAPLTYSFAGDKRFKCHSIVDERAAGYFALGIAQQLKSPVAVVCTSGTAAYNYGPAVAEAFYQRIPLVVITADRPEEWINQGDGQTIMQTNLFGKHVKSSIQIKEDDGQGNTGWHNQRLISEALDSGRYPVSGPIHINVPLAESLYEEYQGAKGDSDARLIRRGRTSARLEKSELQHFVSKLNECTKILVLVGMGERNPDFQSQLEKFASYPAVTVLTETTSNLHSKNFIGCIDRLIMSFDDEDHSDFRPDLLITLGSHIISKKIKALLRSYDIQEHWHVDPDPQMIDTYTCLSVGVRCAPGAFFKQLNAVYEGVPSNYHQKWLLRDNEHQKTHNEYIDQVSFSDFQVVGRVLRKVPPGSNLQMGNSSVVRYIQLFDAKDNIQYSGNRGTSGIDGCTSTASGAATASQTPTTLISGDIAFFYDSNALWNENLPRWLKIIVINNGGGGIFRIIDGPASTPVLEKFFETKHHLRAKNLAAMYGLNYFHAENLAELDQGLENLYRSDKCGILEVITPRIENDKVLKDYFKTLIDAKKNEK
jgi:2-succinyl-5-enolpyruvyl-6-hydroxy-3-cyclohexene-1-carboxylate synthase